MYSVLFNIKLILLIMWDFLVFVSVLLVKTCGIFFIFYLLEGVSCISYSFLLSYRMIQTPGLMFLLQIWQKEYMLVLVLPFFVLGRICRYSGMSSWFWFLLCIFIYDVCSTLLNVEFDLFSFAFLIKKLNLICLVFFPINPRSLRLFSSEANILKLLELKAKAFELWENKVVGAQIFSDINHLFEVCCRFKLLCEWSRCLLLLACV